MNEYLELINDSLDKYLEIKKPEILYDSMRYSLLSKGKRVRPLLVLYSTEALGGDIKKALPFACALEMIHVYSLIHDDLPALDNDDIRRGKPTNHKAYGEDIAILAGDGLLNTAYEISIKYSVENPQLENIKSAYLLAKFAGVSGMIGGQTVDVITEGKEIDENELEYIHENKTAALIRCALSMGATLSGADDKKISLFDEIGRKIGMAFQIKDDILDITSDPETLGKPTGSDEKNQKNTYVSVFGIKKAEEKYKKLSDEILMLISENCGKENNLYSLAESLIYRIN